MILRKHSEFNCLVNDIDFAFCSMVSHWKSENNQHCVEFLEVALIEFSCFDLRTFLALIFGWVFMLYLLGIPPMCLVQWLILILWEYVADKLLSLNLTVSWSLWWDHWNILMPAEHKGQAFSSLPQCTPLQHTRVHMLLDNNDLLSYNRDYLKVLSVLSSIDVATCGSVLSLEVFIP